MIMMRFAKAKAAKKRILRCKKPIKMWDVIVHNITISKLVETENNAIYLIGCFRWSCKTISFVIA